MSHITRAGLCAAVLAVLCAATTAARAQVDHTANDRVIPYEGRFRPGMNLGYLPPWNNYQLADLAAGNPAKGVVGLGAKATRPGLYDKVLARYGYGIDLPAFAYYEDLGLTDLTAIVGFPSDQKRDWATTYCVADYKGDRHWNELFSGIYEPIWDDGTDGTPYNDDNKYAAYLYETVSRYTDYVKFWEIWNEPGLYKGDPAEAEKFWGGPDYPGSWWTNDPDPCDYYLRAPIQSYIRTLRISYEVIKAVSPDDYIAIAGLGSASFLDAILRNTDNPDGGAVTADFPNKGGAYFDVLGFHTYPHLDGSTFFGDTGFARRHSDGAADGLIERRLGTYQDLLVKYGYDGLEYPIKEHICTEINIPRRQFNPKYLGGEDAQINFMTKAMIALKRNRVHQMHVYAISDEEPVEDATFEFHTMGMYEYLPGTPPYTQRVHEAGKAYKTASDFLFPTDYDPTATAALAAPDGVRAYAFRRDDGSTVYVLWAETRTDQSEVASATYSFPAGVVSGPLTRFDYDFAYSGDSTASAPTGIALTGRPNFFTGAAGVVAVNDAPVPTLSATATTLPDAAFAVTVAWSEAVSGLTRGDFVVTGGSATTLTGAGARYTLTVVPTGAGTVRIALPAARAADLEGLASVAAAPLTVTIAAPEVPEASAGVDLALTMSVDAPRVKAFAYVTYSLTLTNTGGATATGVVVSLPKPDKYAYSAQDASTGKYSDWTGKWTVGTVPAGETETLEVTLFTLTAEPRTAFAQVLAARETDADSTPGNGACCVPGEDDEAAATVNGPADDGGGGGTPVVAKADVSLKLATAQATLTANGALAATLTLRNAGPDAATGLVVNVDLPAGLRLVRATPPTGSSYAPVAGGDGRWSVPTLASSAAAVLTLALEASDASAAQALAAELTNADVADPDSAPGNGATTEDDFATLRVQGYAGGGGSGPDLELALSTSSASYKVYQDVPYRLVIRNTGTTAASGVVVAVPYPERFVYTSATATRGSFDAWLQHWTVGTLAAGATATLDLRLFPLRGTGAATVFTQVSAMAGADADSAPGNGACCVPHEDDEAVVVLNPIGAASARVATASAPVIIHGVQPAGFDEVQLLTLTTQLDETRATLVDVLGRPVREFVLAEGIGTHRAELDLAGLASGTYYLMVRSPGGMSGIPLVVQD